MLVFQSGVRGLAPGAPVEFRGLPIGQVEDVRAEGDANTLEFNILVTISLDPQRLGVVVRGSGAGQGVSSAAHRQMVERMVSKGFRAQLRTGSLLTGALFVEMDFFPDAPPFKVDWSQNPVRLATVPGKLEGLDASIAGIIKKLDQVQYQEIGEDLRKTLAGVDQTLAGIDQELPNALREMNGAARSLRSLADYLDRHPEALIKGKSPAKGE
jgi:paraquat-inducible protein B